ncbi:DUF3084 domain-containing protein [Prochlorococcus sp. MIT 1300]|uniref:DUF3084 domain-containing protein n=1 Tax=Prochlorococcus sp. MIT 1300 TaxID=3096218 RepID=UPI002A75E22B|nr:DUF3084 domain-containing protein [Prochlorococcus sp. MIT 1300]
MTGWLLIVLLLVLGGVLSTLGDRLGSRVGKARLSIFNLRPRSTAVLITVLTGSLISFLSLGLMLLVSRQLRVGLFQLDGLQAKIKAAQKELRLRESNLIALRRGAVVLSSGQRLATAKFRLDNPNQAKGIIDRLLQEANLEAFRRVLPGEKPNRQILRVPREEIQKLKETISESGTWVVNFRSAGNVLLGEKWVYAIPEVRPNIAVVQKGDVLGKITLNPRDRTTDVIRKQINLLLASTFAEVRRRGSLSSGLQFDASSVNQLGKELVGLLGGTIILESFALKSSDTSDQVKIGLRIKQNINKPDKSSTWAN